MNNVFYKNTYLRWSLRRLKELPNHIAACFHRAIRGWDYIDAWDIASWFMRITPQLLQHMCDEGIGYPGDSDHPTRDSWEATLQRMMFLLKEMNEETCSQQNEELNKWIDSNCTFVLDDNVVLARQNEIDTYRYKCKNEFFELFSKYFYNLWD